MPNLRHKSEDTVTNYRGPSVNIFGDLDDLRAKAAMGQAVFYDNDFIAAPQGTLTSATQMGEYYTYQDSGVTIKSKASNDPDVELGVLSIAGYDADEDEGAIQFGGNQFEIDNTAGNDTKLGYEVRIRCDELAAAEVILLLGLYGGPVGADMTITAAGSVANTKSFIGFASLTADPDKLDFIYQAVADSGATVAKANAATLTEDTYANLGFLYDPKRPDSKRLTCYVNGVAVGYVTKTQIDAATFPEAEAMVPVVAMRALTVSMAGTVEIDRITAARWMPGSF